MAVKWYGETEFWAALGKMLLIIGLIIYTFVAMLGKSLFPLPNTSHAHANSRRKSLGRQIWLPLLERARLLRRTLLRRQSRPLPRLPAMPHHGLLHNRRPRLRRNGGRRVGEPTTSHAAGFQRRLLPSDVLFRSWKSGGRHQRPIQRSGTHRSVRERRARSRRFALCRLDEPPEDPGLAGYRQCFGPGVCLLGGQQLCLLCFALSLRSGTGRQSTQDLDQVSIIFRLHRTWSRILT
jgi:hypothetical protein